MGWLTAVKSVFAAPDTAGKALEMGNTIIEGISNGADKMFFTAEEKAEFNQKGAETILEFWKSTANENTEQSKARRELAKMTFKVFFFLLISACALYRFDSEWAIFILKIAGTITFIVSAITVIYFGPHQLSKIWKKGDK